MSVPSPKVPSISVAAPPHHFGPWQWPSSRPAGIGPNKRQVVTFLLPHLGMIQLHTIAGKSRATLNPAQWFWMQRKLGPSRTPCFWTPCHIAVYICPAYFFLTSWHPNTWPYVWAVVPHDRRFMEVTPLSSRHDQQAWIPCRRWYVLEFDAETWKRTICQFNEYDFILVAPVQWDTKTGKFGPHPCSHLLILMQSPILRIVTTIATKFDHHTHMTHLPTFR